jgi:hypothetical protein
MSLPPYRALVSRCLTSVRCGQGGSDIVAFVGAIWLGSLCPAAACELSPPETGTVAVVRECGGRLYLNFTADWRSDFTISVERKDVSAFAAGGIDLKNLAGKRLRGAFLPGATGS